MEIIEIRSHGELPYCVEMVLYGKPFYGEELQEIITEFKRRYGHEPQTVYHIGNQYFVVKEEK